MEFSFEYFDFLKIITLDIVKSIAFFGVLLLIVPIRLIAAIMKPVQKKKLTDLGVIYLFSTWFMGLIIIGVLSFYIFSALKLGFVWIAIALVNLTFVLTNHRRLHKAYQNKIDEIMAKK